MHGAASERAKTLALPSARDAEAQVRTCLLRQDADLENRNNVYRIFKTTRSHGVVSISVEPTFDKGPTDSHFYLESGARLSFGIILRESNSRCSLVAYRFQLNLPQACVPSF